MATAAEDPNATAADAAHASGHTDVGYYALYFLFLSLVLGALARGATRHSRLPYTVALLFVGLALGFLHSYVDLGALGDSLDIWVDIGPHTMLAVFLPALVFESAFSLEWHTFRRCATQVLWLAGPGVLMGTALVGALLKATLPYDWGWGSSLMLGSILSATDPVAVVALLKEVGASKRLGHIIEGESLVNDGTAIVVFSLLNEIAKGAHKTAGEVATFFLWVPFGSVLVGVGVAIGCHAWLGLGAVAGDHIVQISVTLFACYLCFLVAEFQSEASGVLACVVLGVSIGAFGRGFFTGETEHSLHHFWEMLTFVANTVLFILTGVIIAKTTNESTLAGTLHASDLGWSLIVYFEVLFARAAVIGILYPILARRGYGLTLADAAVCWWGGLRGAVGLALALAVNEGDAEYADEKVGPMALLCTGVVVVLTLAVNGTTTGFLLQKLGLTRPEVSVQVAVRKARRHIRRQCMAVYHEHLTTHDDVMGTADFRAVSELVPFLDEKEEEEAKEDAEAAARRVVARAAEATCGGCLPCARACRDCVKAAFTRAPPAASAEETANLGAASGSPAMSKDASESNLRVLQSSFETAGSGGAGGLILSRHRRRGSDADQVAAKGGAMTPASSIANLAAFAEAAEAAEKAKKERGDQSPEPQPARSLAPVAEIPVVAKNALGEINAPPPDLAAAVTLAVRRDFEDSVAVWQRDVRGRFLAHLKVLYWESLEEGRATKEVVETLVECADIALDELDAPLCDWTALRSRVLGKAQKGSSLWKRLYRGLPGPLRDAVKWTRQWVLHSGAVGAGGSRRRALVSAALFHDARLEAAHAIFGHLDGAGSGASTSAGGDFESSADDGKKEKKESSDQKLVSEKNKKRDAASTSADVNDVSLLYDSDDGRDAERDPAHVAARRVRAEAERDADAAKAYLRAARTNEPELAAAVKSEETARRLLATAERSARGYVQSGLLTEAEAAELLSLVSRAQRRLRLDPPEPVTRDPRDLMRMSPLLDPTHAARVRDVTLCERLTRDAPSYLVRRYPGDLVDPTALGVPPGGLLLLARGVVDVEWSRPIGEGGGGGSKAPLRVGASSTSYGWALGAADLLVPGAARFKARAVSTVTAFVLPPDLVRAMLGDGKEGDATRRGSGERRSGDARSARLSLDGRGKKSVEDVVVDVSEALITASSSAATATAIPTHGGVSGLNGTADALWRAAFGLLAATVLRDDLASAEVPARAVRQAVTRAKISRKEIGARVGPYAGRGVGGDASRDVKGGAQSELVVLLAGEVYDETEGALVGPCVLAPDPVAAARVFGGDSSRAAAFGKLAARMGMSSHGATVHTPDGKAMRSTSSTGSRRGSTDGGAVVSGASVFADGAGGSGGWLQVNERATILRAPLTRAAGGGPNGSGLGGTLGSSGGSGVVGNISSPPKVTSYLPGLEGSGWGKFGKNPLTLSRAANGEHANLDSESAKIQNRRLSVNVGSLGAARARIKEEGRDPDAEFSRFLSETRAGNRASSRTSEASSRNPRDEDEDEDGMRRADSGGDLRTLAEGEPLEFLGAAYPRTGGLVGFGGSPPATSEGSDIYTSSLDRTTAHILARDIKRDIFAPRRRSLDARSKAVDFEAAALAGSAIADDAAFRAGASPSQSARRANVSSPRASLGSIFGTRKTDKEGGAGGSPNDTFPPRVQFAGGGSPGDTFPPRPAGGGSTRRGAAANRRGSIGAALFKATGGGSSSSANPEETFPPRRSRALSVAKPKVVEWTHEASSSEDEATIKF